MHKKPSDKKPWAGILHVGKIVRVTGKPYGWAATAQKLKNLTWCGAFWEPLWKTVEWGQVQTQEYLLPFHVPFPPCSCLCLSNLWIFWQKQEVLLSYVNCCVHSPSVFSTISSMQWRSVSCICRAIPSGLQFLKSEADYLHRVTEMSPPVYIAQLVLRIKGHLKVPENRIAGKSEVAFHVILISGGGMRHTTLMEKN